jgi:hypothetical protein
VYGLLNRHTSVAAQKSESFAGSFMRTSEPKPHWINGFSSVLSIPKFETWLRENDTNFGIGTLAGLLLGKTTPDSVYGLKMSPVVNCATVLPV